YELQPYVQIINVANNSREVRAFIFGRKDGLYVVFWHISGAKRLEIPLNYKDVTLLENLYNKHSVAIAKKSKNILIPVNDRKYLKIKRTSRNQVIKAFKRANII